MSNQNNRELSRQYRQLPRVDSPNNLDQKILHEARIRTPEKQRNPSHRWVPALAAACVAGVVFYVAAPSFQPGSYLAPEPDATVSQEIAEEQSNTSALMDEPDDVIQASPAPSVSSAISKADRSQSTSLMAEPTPVKKLAESKEKQTKQRARRQQLDDSKQRLGGIANIATSGAEADASFRLEAEKKSERLRSDSELREVGLSTEEVERRLAEITAMADKALLEQAQRLLDDLIAKCPDCVIPETVAELQDSRLPATTTGIDAGE